MQKAHNSRVKGTQTISLGGHLLCFISTKKKEHAWTWKSDTSTTRSNARKPFLYIFSESFMLQRSPQLHRSSEIHSFCRWALKIPRSIPDQVPCEPPGCSCQIPKIFKIAKLRIDRSPGSNAVRTSYWDKSCGFCVGLGFWCRSGHHSTILDHQTNRESVEIEEIQSLSQDLCSWEIPKMFKTSR